MICYQEIWDGERFFRLFNTFMGFNRTRRNHSRYFSARKGTHAARGLALATVAMIKNLYTLGVYT